MDGMGLMMSQTGSASSIINSTNLHNSKWRCSYLSPNPKSKLTLHHLLNPYFMTLRLLYRDSGFPCSLHSLNKYIHLPHLALHVNAAGYSSRLLANCIPLQNAQHIGQTPIFMCNHSI
ncbi:unnamed protein product [Ilex paraguariensis]|uniref:Uncharacterized protein n=1 Tax=Ilex paraguariensis TaxID=185542 RepID=A0ABC8TLQ7_9AQUA